MVEIELTEDQALFLANILSETTDEGPEGYGWKSTELEDLITIIDDAISDSQGTD